MTIEIAAPRKQFTRRAALGGAAAMVAAPAFARSAGLGRHPTRRVRSFGWIWTKWNSTQPMTRLSMRP
jgi:hypothetical protein